MQDKWGKTVTVLKDCSCGKAHGTDTMATAYAVVGAWLEHIIATKLSWWVAFLALVYRLEHCILNSSISLGTDG